MAEVKFTKNAFREQQQKLMQLQSYLPTLQLKKKMLQFEISVTHVLLDNLYKNYQKQRNEVDEYSKLFSDKEGKDIVKYASVMHVEKSYENIAGVEIPNLKRVVFTEDTYNLFETPPWVDGALVKLKELVKIKQNMNVIEEKKRALAKELRDVSIRVNLFEFHDLPHL